MILELGTWNVKFQEPKIQNSNLFDLRPFWFFGSSVLRFFGSWFFELL